MHVRQAALDAIAGAQAGVARQPDPLLRKGGQQAVAADLLAAVEGDVDKLGVGSVGHHQDGLSHVEGEGPSITSRAPSHRRAAMHLHHVAIRAQDPEPLKAFHCPLFGGQTNGRDHKPSRSAPTSHASRGRQSGAGTLPQRLAAQPK
ncbi:hypothetical protein D3C76_547970 [compost metagenome]